MLDYKSMENNRESSKQNDNSGYKNKREAFEYSLRKRNMEEMLNKKRQMLMQSSGQAIKELKIFEEEFARFKRYVEERRYQDAINPLKTILAELRGLEDNYDFNEFSIQQIFDISFRNSFWGCCKTFLKEGDLDSIKYALMNIRKITSSTNLEIVNYIIDSKLQEELFAIIHSGRFGGDYSVVVHLAFCCVSNLYSDNDAQIEELFNSGEARKLVMSGLLYRADKLSSGGFLQLLCAMISSKHWPMKELISKEVLDLIMDCISERSVEFMEYVTDAVSVVEFLTDCRGQEDEKPYETIILYLLDLGFYSIVLNALEDENIQPKLGILCARALGNALTLENYPLIDTVI